eukprot:CAMPEP_0198257218 /NCGR_PEP_ID=MMETSP1447-20131203/6946_1 /TAXON_ID=420782 /ORGANISM="Chaetoceros dichaeta, Strain CCMP1751" /LENGTH=190 /DNA_ID=CAMNT_0043944057 /DNA_START=26 /DNA_END=598 /DNA_ORIENTATION=+
MIAITKLLLLYTTTLILFIPPSSHTTNASTTTRTKEELAKIYKEYDVEDDIAPPCPHDLATPTNADSLCPNDDGATSIGRIETITQFCIDNLTNDELIHSRKTASNSRSNAIQGCIKFVGCYIVRNRQKIPTCYACCKSDRCDKFLREQYIKMGILWDDDDDDQVHEDDDSAFEDDGVLGREEAVLETDL